MSLRDRIRRIEEKLSAAVSSSGKPLPPPDIITEYFKPIQDADGNNIYGGQRCDSLRASVSCDGSVRYYDRKAGESYKSFQDRVLATHPRGRFPRVLTMMTNGETP